MLACVACRVYGEAFLLIKSETKQQVVVKHVPLDCMDETEVKSALGEVAALCAMQHPNVVRCLGSWVSPGGQDGSSQLPWDPGSENARLPTGRAMDLWLLHENSGDLGSIPPSLNILTEYVNGGALDRLIARNCSSTESFEEELIGSWVAQLILGIEHMHRAGVLHRDLKPANIFITKSGIVKIGDLGCCKMLERPEESCSSDYGSPLYQSPEVWQIGKCSHKSDIWSVGCIAHELMAHEAPFDAPELAFKVINNTPPPLPESYSGGLRAVVGEMLTKDAAARPSAVDLIRNPAIGQHIKRWLAAGHAPPLGEGHGEGA